MISVDITYRKDDPKSVDVEQVPEPILKAIMHTRLEHPIDNEILACPKSNLPFDRLFEQLYSCRIEYKDEGYTLSRIVWDNDRDYTAFLLKWV